jgi:hypothetical protein
MFKIVVNVDISKALAKIGAARDQVPFATALALTKTAQDVKAAAQGGMDTAFENVTRYTRNSLAITAATKAALTAYVGVRGGETGAVKWLRPEIFGGQRQSGIEVLLKQINLPPPGMYAVPGANAKLTSNKKVDINWLASLVGAIQIQGQSGITIRQGKGKNARKGGAGQYFVLLQKWGKLPPGIYGKRGTAVFPYIIFVRQAVYKKRFDFYGIAASTARQQFPIQFTAALKRAMATRL